MMNVAQTIISQYGNSASLRQLIDSFNAYLDQTFNMVGATSITPYVVEGYWPDDYVRNNTVLGGFYDYIWNIETAVGFGLDILGRIVGASRTLQILQPLEYFGFGEGGSDYQPFNQAPFYNGASATDAFILSDDAYRLLIMVKALANISTTDSASLNRLLQSLFVNRGRCYVNDLGAMQMRYTFEFTLLPYEKAILTANQVLPHPGGVGAFLLAVDAGGTFGFSEAGPESQPFGFGTFLSPGAFYALS